MTRDTDSDVTPIRRHTKRTRSAWKNPVFLSVAVTVAVAVVVLVILLARKGHGIPIPGLDPYPEGSHLYRHESKWWTAGATPAKLQAMVDALTKKSYLEIVFNSEGDFTVSPSMSISDIEEMTKLGNRRSSGRTGYYDMLRRHAERYRDRYSDPSVVLSGDTFQLRGALAASKPGERLSALAARNIIEDALSGKPITGSGRLAK
jgi:hypothetical protein